MCKRGKTALKVAAGIVAGCTVACAIVHRNAIKAKLKGEPLPEPPEWHKKFHPCLK